LIFRSEAETYRNVPELRLPIGKSKSELVLEFKLAVRQHEQGSDEFLASVCRDRPDLAGLPFLKGADCRLNTQQESRLAQTSIAIRQALDEHERESKNGGIANDPRLDVTDQSRCEETVGKFLPRGPGGDKMLGVFVRERTGYDPGPAVPALMQILGPLPAPFRVELSRRWSSYAPDSDAVVAASVRLALFDPETDVRQAAVKTLEQLPVEKYGPKLVDGFRHPSPYVAEHAADAVAALNRAALLTMVVDVLDEPDPAAPIEQNEAGTRVPAIREMVKVNHLRNCLLCHAPVAPAVAENGAGRGVLRTRNLIAPIPFPDEPLPPSSLAYYQSFRPTDMLVRVNEVYLRQDFSRLERVDKHGKWPEQQRFDYLVRTRPLSVDEIAKAKTKSTDDMPTPHRRAVLSALSRVTQTYLGTKSSDWREEIAWRVAEEEARRQ
jgi:hypothetical protein